MFEQDRYLLIGPSGMFLLACLCVPLAFSVILHGNLKLCILCGEPSRYKRNGLLPMLKRNTSVKLAPQRWQDNAGDGVFDMIMTFEERVFDLVVEGKFIHLSTGAWFWSRRIDSSIRRLKVGMH